MAADMTGTDTPSPSKPATINLQDEPQKGEDKTGSERDSARMNDHVRTEGDLPAPICIGQIRFHDVIAEPDTEAQSSDRVWELSEQLFATTKHWTYRVLSLVLAVPCAVCWGCQFATLAFCHVWCCVPCLKVCDVKLLCVRRVCQGLAGACIGPVAENAGKFLGGIRARMTTETV